MIQFASGRAQKVSSVRPCGILTLAMLLVVLTGAIALQAQGQETKISAPPGGPAQILELRIGDEIEPVMAEYVDGGNRGSCADSRKPGPDHDGHSRRVIDFHGGHHPAHSGFARAGGRLSFRRPDRAGLPRDFLFCFRRTSRPWLPERTRERLRRFWRSAEFRCRWTRR